VTYFESRFLSTDTADASNSSSNSPLLRFSSTRSFSSSLPLSLSPFLFFVPSISHSAFHCPCRYKHTSESRKTFGYFCVTIFQCAARGPSRPSANPHICIHICHSYCQHHQGQGHGCPLSTPSPPCPASSTQRGTRTRTASSYRPAT